MPPAERLARLRLAPLRSARALTDPQRAMRRAVRVIATLCGADAVRCTASATGCSARHRRRGSIDAAPAYTVALHDGGIDLGRIDVECAEADWLAARPLVESIAGTLAVLLAAHAAPVRALRGVWLSAQRLHDLNNTVSAITLQLGVIQTLLQRGRDDEAKAFAERCVCEGDRLIELLARLRHG